MRKGDDRKYKLLRDKFLQQHPLCQARLTGCTLKSTDCHHKKGREQHYLNQDELLSCCRSCHTWIGDHPLEALELGFSKKRLNKE